MIEQTNAQRTAWAERAKAELIAAGAEVARLSSGAVCIRIAGNVLVVHDLADINPRTFKRLIHRGAP